MQNIKKDSLFSFTKFIVTTQQLRPPTTQRWLAFRRRCLTILESICDAMCLSWMSAFNRPSVIFNIAILRLMASSEASSPWLPSIMRCASFSCVPGWRWKYLTCGRSRRSRVVRSLEETGPYEKKFFSSRGFLEYDWFPSFL